MKSFLTLLAIVCITSCCSGQDINQYEVPSIIINRFKKEFPKAKDIEWELENKYYKVEFEIGFFDTDYEAWFTTSGKLVKYTKDISKYQLPQAVKNTIKTKFNGYRIDDVKAITQNNTKIYLVEIKKRNEERDISFNTNGTLI